MTLLFVVVLCVCDTWANVFLFFVAFKDNVFLN